MRYMLIVKTTPEDEAGPGPGRELLEAMGKYNEELVNAGVLLAGEGLLPSATGARVRFASGGRTTVVDGPFTESKELVGGFWILQVKDHEEALEWARRIPNPDDAESEVEVRRVAEAEDFGDEFTPELREQEARQRDRIAGDQ